MRALIAEDQALLREGLTRILEASDITVAAVDNGPQLEKRLARDDFDIAVVDVRLPPTFTTEGITAAIAARADRPTLPVLVLSQHVEPAYARDLLASGQGSIGYLLKDRVADVDEFVTAVRRVAAGATILDPEVVAALVTGSAGNRPLHRLTSRERDVLTLMAEGRSNAAIAARLFVTEKAVGKHTNAIFTKLDLLPAPTTTAASSPSSPGSKADSARGGAAAGRARAAAGRVAGAVLAVDRRDAMATVSACQ